MQRVVFAKIKEHQRNGDLPTNGRFLFYELLQEGHVAKHDPHHRKQPAAYVTEALTHLRKCGLVPWDWIVDETREIVEWRYAATVAQYIVDAAQSARIDCWDSALPPLIVCESRAVKGVLQSRVAAAYLCPITATGGQAGGFLHTDILPLLENADREVLYLGDHEIGGPGEQIECNARRVLELECGHALNWSRIALTQAQVDADPQLQRLVITKSDGRRKSARRYRAVECEAVGQSVLEQILRDALDARLPAPLKRVFEGERRQRRDAVAMLRKAAGIDYDEEADG